MNIGPHNVYNRTDQLPQPGQGQSIGGGAVLVPWACQNCLSV